MAQHREADIPVSKKPTATVESPPAADEPLPEWEELTPEVLEDECRRGDFMIRWALVLLAVLLGWTYITETSVLVSIRTGEAIASRGGLPPRVDIFSATAEGRAWTNLHWLTDLIVAGMHTVAGMPGLTVLCAVVTGLAFYLLTSINWENDSTWWPSFCAGFALVAVVPMFQPGETTITLLGISLLMWLLHRWNTAPGGSLKWQLPLLFAAWGNLDSRAWAGMVILLAYLIGTLATRLPQLRKARGKTFAVGGLALLAGLLISPWPLGQLFSPLMWQRTLQEAAIYQETSGFGINLMGPLLSTQTGRPVDPFALVFFVLAMLSLLVLALNYKRAELSWGLMWLAAAGLSTISRELACLSAIVMAACAAINGQHWYRRTFSMEYSINDWSILAGRLGRAASVLALFFVAWLGVNGALMGPQGRRIGLGLDPRWRNRISSLEQDVLPGTFKDRVFCLLPSQGDVLIWLKLKPFIDSRLAMYSTGDVDLAELHRITGNSVFAPPRPGDSGIDPNAWKATFAEYDIANVQVRLWGNPPAYLSLMRLMINPDWRLTALGAAAANYVRVDAENSELTAHIESHRADHFITAAFRPEELPTSSELTATWAYAPSTYNQWLIQKMTVIPEAAQLARHYNEIETQLQQGLTAQQVAGLATLAIRKAQQALIENPNDVLSYRILADSQMLLQQIELAAVVASGSPPLPNWRLSQIRAAAYNVLKAGGQTPDNLVPIINFLHRQKEIDLCLAFVRMFEQKVEADSGPLTAENWQQLGMGAVQMDRSTFEEYEAKTKEAIDAAREEGAPVLEQVQMAIINRCPLLALQILENNLTLAQSPDGKMMYAHLLLTCGDLESAFLAIKDLQPLLNREDLPPEAAPLVKQAKALSAEIRAAMLDLPGAIELWEPESWEELERSLVNNLLVEPFAAMMPPSEQDTWAASTGRLAVYSLAQEPDRWGQAELRIALTEIQLGKLEEAKERLLGIYDHHPRFSWLGLVRFYLELLEGKAMPLEPPPLKYQLPDVVIGGGNSPPSPALPVPLESE